METADVELVNRGEKRDSRGRVIQTREERERILESFDKSGMTQKAFARSEGITYSTLVWWLKQRRERQKPVQQKPRFEEISLGSPSRSFSVEVVLPDGTAVRGSHPMIVAQTIQALGR